MIHEDKGVATEYVEKLSEYFRIILSYRKTDTIPIEEELELLNTFYYLQKKRYGKDLLLEIRLEKSILKQKIPPMTLQILFENAVKHNEISQDNPLKIKIFNRSDSIVVENNLQKKLNPGPSTGTGLENIKNRYNLISGTTVREQTDGGYFRVVLPFMEDENEGTDH